jgi:hypothetical protein
MVTTRRRHDMSNISFPRDAQRAREKRCPHVPRCPDDVAHDRSGARTIASHPEQGWSLLCNGVVVFDDGGALLPGGRALPADPPADLQNPGILTRQTAARARENREFVRHLLTVRQPRFATVLESAVQHLTPGRRNALADLRVASARGDAAA